VPSLLKSFFVPTDSFLSLSLQAFLVSRRALHINTLIDHATTEFVKTCLNYHILTCPYSNLSDYSSTKCLSGSRSFTPVDSVLAPFCVRQKISQSACASIAAFFAVQQSIPHGIKFSIPDFFGHMTFIRNKTR
jgi:hypothetical protein